MKKNFYNGDLEVGMILTTRNGNKYVLVADDFGDLDVINLSTACSNWFVYDDDGRKFYVCGGKDGGRDVVKVEAFDAIPTRNRLSEALKTLIGKPYTEKLVTVWEQGPVVDEKAVRDARKKIAVAQEQLDDAYALLHKYGFDA
jgi:hypothetical protein